MTDSFRPNSDCGHSDLYSYTDADGKSCCLYCRMLTAEAKVVDLQRQLEDMREQLEDAETDRIEALERATEFDLPD